MQYHSNQISFQVYKNQELPFQYDQNLLIFFGLRGTSRILCDNTSYELEPSGVLVVNPFELYRIICPQTSSMICLRIAHSLLQLSGWQDTLSCSCYERTSSEKHSEYDSLRKLYASIFRDFFQNNENHASYMGTALQMIGLLQSHFSIQAASHSRRDAALQRIQRILDTIHIRWNEDIFLSEIAEKEYLSISYLSRFFKKNLHTTFSQYVLDLRLQHAAEMLVQNTRPVTQIAYDCGFRAPSAFIEVFKQHYGQTPKQFRQEQQELHNRQAVGLPESDAVENLDILLSYAPEREQSILPVHTTPVSIVCTPQRKIAGWRRILNVGYARDCLLAPVQEQIKRAQQEIGFEFMRFHGLFDVDMRIYRETEDGTPQFDFTYVNLLFDFILSLGIKPFIELSFMPSELARAQTKIFDRPSIISGCRDLKKWSLLVQTTLLHFVNRYGRKEVCSWRFTTIARGYVYIGCVEPKDYTALYCTTYQAVKGIDPAFQFGGPGCFAAEIHLNNALPAFLQEVCEQDCTPDFITVQCYPHIHLPDDALFMDYTISQQSAPAILTDDADFLIHTLERMEQQLQASHLPDPEIFIEECSSTLWQRDLSSETCYKSAWLAKNVCANLDKAVFGYWLLTDLMEERATLESLFHGGYGLFTYNGIPKAGYYAMQLLSRMGSELIDSGIDWLLTREGADYQLMTWNYCHYGNLYRYRYQRLEQPKDAYSVFEDGHVQRFQFRLDAIADGRYRIERRTITRQSGSSFDKWLELGSPRYVRPDELRYLKGSSCPSYRVEEIRAENGLAFEITLNPLEVEHIIIHKLDEF